VVAIVGGEFTVKRLGTDHGQLTLIAENPSFSAIPLQANDDPELWGVVTWCLQKRIQR
jgi:DNA polymerase V